MLILSYTHHSFSIFNDVEFTCMKILIVSDSHGNNEALDKLYQKYPNMDLYLHAGDSESDEYSIRPFLSVKGNCDYFTTAPERRIMDTPYGTLLIQHHPILQNNLIKEYNIKFFVFGHTHRRKNEIDKGLILINPGSISFSRDGHDQSYVILNIEEDSYNIEFYELT